MIFERDIQEKIEQFIAQRFEKDKKVIIEKTSDISKLVFVMEEFLNEAISSSGNGSKNVLNIKEKLKSININSTNIETLSKIQIELINAASSIEKEMNSVSDKLQSGKTKVQELEDKINSLEIELKQTKNESMRDYLTGLLSRKVFFEELKKIDSSFERMGVQYAVIFFDIDNFKSIKYKFNPPNFAYIHKELRRKGVTLELLHEEYATSNPNGYYGYTWFCNEYKKYSKKVNISMRQVHVAGEKLFIDFSGMTMNVLDKDSGEISKVQIFVAVLGASDYPFVKAIATQSKKDFINVHVDMFKYFGGVPNVLVPDNLKSAVSKACNFDPDINPDYLAMARHYNTVIIPARVAKPKDKAKVENGVKIVQRWILAILRNHIFFNIEALNLVIEKLIPIYVNKKMKRLDKSRLELFV